MSHERAKQVLTAANVQGVPELVVEIASKSTRKRDETIKRRLYERVGVAEYRVVDPAIEVVRIYRRAGTGTGFSRPIRAVAGGGRHAVDTAPPGLQRRPRSNLRSRAVAPSSLLMDRRDFLALASAAVLGGVAAPASGQTSDLADLTMAEAIARVAPSRRLARSISCGRACPASTRHDAALHAFITVTGDQALAEAQDAGGRSPAWPMARPAARHPHRAQGQHRHRRRAHDRRQPALRASACPRADAEVARRLKQAGAILLGKLNLHEFAYGGSSTVTAFGTDAEPLAARPRDRAGRPAAPAWRWPRACATPRSAPTPRAPSACPPRTAASSG